MAFSREIGCFTGKLLEILRRELSDGNVISEAYRGNWPYPNSVVIVLENPFSPPIYRDMEGIRFRNVNDPHYWKAEYYDASNHLLLACKFGGEPDFDEL